MAKIVTEILNKIDLELSKNITFINQGKNNGRDIPMAEVRFSTNEWAKKARMMFVTKLKGGEDFGRVHIANSVCLATRVRVDILKAVAKQFAEPNGNTMYVSSYSTRPMLHIKSDSEQKPFALTFADAMTKFGSELDQERLGEAYKRAGRAFTGQLEQQFVVLKEQAISANLTALGDLRNSRKRPLEDQSTSYAKRSWGSGNRGQGTVGGRGQAKGVRK